MSIEVLERRFEEIGARVKVAEDTVVRIDVGVDRRGEYFDLRLPADDAQVVDARRRERHLLLLVRDGRAKSKFLCGHDERHWFVAAVPESERGVTGVASAKAALQPDAVRELVTRDRPKDPFRRRNAAYVRQGEWFFVPARGFEPPKAWVLRNEPLIRGAGKPHVMELAYRTGGQVVFVDLQNGRQLGEARFTRLPHEQQRNGRWQRMVRDPEVYASGAVRHSDHATLMLRGWHRVLMNTENRAAAMRYVVFYD